MKHCVTLLFVGLICLACISCSLKKPSALTVEKTGIDAVQTQPVGDSKTNSLATMQERSSSDSKTQPVNTAKTQPAKRSDSKEASLALSAISGSMTDFSFALHRRLGADGKNTVFSPFSIYVALAMTLTGAEGNTEKEMMKTLKLDGDMPPETVTLGCRAFLDEMFPTEYVKLNTANSIWIAESLKVKDAFKNGAEQYFDAQIKNEIVLEKINLWVSERTNNMIPQLLETLSPQTEMVLLNAVYFKGNWEFIFREDLTRDSDFTLLDGKKIRVPMMTREMTYMRYYKNQQYEVVCLPYEKHEMSMYVFLPSRQSNVKELIFNLDTPQWKAIREKVIMQKVGVRLPKFSLTYDRELNGDLFAMGMKEAFDGRANFSKISKDPLCIDLVQHKAKISVDEMGAEASAATAIVVVKSLDEDRIDFVVDRPFFYIICNEKNGVPIFMGCVTDPRK